MPRKLSRYLRGLTTEVGIRTSRNLIIATDERLADINDHKLQVDSGGVFTGSVGIGTTNPSGDLEVHNDFARIRLKSTRTGLTEQIGGIGFSTSLDDVATINVLVDGTVLIKNTTNNTERMRVGAGGTVYIGPNGSSFSPRGQLHIERDLTYPSNDYRNANLLTLENIADNQNTVQTLIANWTGNNRYANIILEPGSTQNSSKLHLSANLQDANHITIQGDGQIGINSTTPAAVLDVVGHNAEDAIFSVRSYNKKGAVRMWPGDVHDLDRWRIAMWENNAVSDGNNYPDWSVDGYGRSWQSNNIYIGRVRTYADAPANRYRYYGNSGPGIFVYNGVDGNDSNVSAQLNLRCYQTDADDRNVIYWAYTGTTNTLDYDQHQKFGVKANGKVQGLNAFFSGRVESDEATPNSVYYSGRGGFYGYDTNGTALSYLLAEAGGSTTTYFTFNRTSNDDVQWKHRTSDGRMYVDAAATTFNGADYAEYFEWDDGNANNEDRAGYTVVLKNGNKIGIATSGDSPSSIIGVISGAPAIVGDGQDLSWQGKWLKDEFGREVTTDVEYLVWNSGYEDDENGNRVPVAQPNPDDQMSMEGSDKQVEVGSKLDAAIAEGTVPQFAIDNNIRMTGQRRVKNPEYNPDAIYVPREFRPEWSPVGLVGKLIVRKGQVMGDRWIKMKDINEQLEQWLVR